MGKWKSAADVWRETAEEWERRWHVADDRSEFQKTRADTAEADRDEYLEQDQMDQRDLVACESRAKDYLDEIKGLRIQLAERTEQRDMWAEAYWNYFNRRTPSFIHRCAPCTRRHWPFR